MSRYCLGALPPKPTAMLDFAHYLLEPLPPAPDGEGAAPRQGSARARKDLT